jgi:hypothetical protein
MTPARINWIGFHEHDWVCDRYSSAWMAEIAMDAITANPKDHEHFKQAAFDLFWKGSAV